MTLIPLLMGMPMRHMRIYETYMYHSAGMCKRRHLDIDMPHLCPRYSIAIGQMNVRYSNECCNQYCCIHNRSALCNSDLRQRILLPGLAGHQNSASWKAGLTIQPSPQAVKESGSLILMKPLTTQSIHCSAHSMCQHFLARCHIRGSGTL